MALTSWNDQYSVNIPELDQQHQKLLAMLNELHEAMKQGKSKEIVEKLVYESFDYAARHFTYEEQLMKKAGYSEFMSHKKMHEAFQVQISEFKRALEEQDRCLSLNMLNFFKKWAVDHICQEDKKYFSALTAVK